VFACRKRFQLTKQGGYLLGDRHPDDAGIDIEVGMDQTVAHADDGLPGNRRMRNSFFLGDLARRLADDFNRTMAKTSI
jgi:hypothetical protein